MLLALKIPTITTMTMLINFNKYWFVILMTFVLSCRSGEQKFKSVSTDKFTIDIQDYMVEMDFQNPEAALQYGNDLESFYIVVIRESHEKLATFGFQMNLDEYSDLMITCTQASIGKASIKALEYKPLDIEAKGFEIEGVDNEERPIYYQIMYYRTDNAFYSIKTWCDGHRKEHFAPLMERVLNSLTEK